MTLLGEIFAVFRGFTQNPRKYVPRKIPFSLKRQIFRFVFLQYFCAKSPISCYILLKKRLVLLRTFREIKSPRKIKKQLKTDWSAKINSRLIKKFAVRPELRKFLPAEISPNKVEKVWNKINLPEFFL